MEQECGRWNKVILIVYERLLIAPEMNEENKKFQECYAKGVNIRESMMTLTPYAHRNAM